MALIGSVTTKTRHRPARPGKTQLMLLSPLGERLGEGVMQEAVFGLTPSPNLSPKGERNMKMKGQVAANGNFTPPSCRWHAAQ